MFSGKIKFDYDNIPLERRKKEVDTILAMKDNDDKIPIIVQTTEKSKLVLSGKQKYLVASKETVGTFMYELRKRLTLAPQDALFLFSRDRTIFPTGSKLGDIYKKYKDEDGFLKIAICEEPAYGNQ